MDVVNVSLCTAGNTSLDELDLSWNCFRRRSAVALIKGLEVTNMGARRHGQGGGALAPLEML